MSEIDTLAPKYKLDLDTICRDFIAEIEASPENLSFGPIYKVKTKQGNTHEILTYMYDNSPPDTFNRQYFAIAIDKHDKAIGHEHMTIHKPISRPDEDHFESDAYITTGLRGKGMATALEIVCHDILERECVRLGKRVTSIIYENQILEDLKRLERRPLINEDEQAKQMLQKQAELEAWNHLYGKSGILGFGEDGTKCFDPKTIGKRQTLDSLQEIEMTAEYYEQEGRVLVRPIIKYEVSVEDGTRYHQQRLEQLRSQIFPQLSI